MMEKQFEQPEQHEQHDFVEAKYRRVGGWLLVWVILVSIGAVGNIGTAVTEVQLCIEHMADFMAEHVFYPVLFSQLLVFVAVGLLATSIIQVFLRKHMFLLFYQISQMLIIFSCIVDIVVVIVIFRENIEEAQIVVEVLGNVFGNTIGFFLWALYFSKSERVRTYMGGTEYMDKAIVAFRGSD
ncbi:MAG: DUF2569 family protein [Defluviitaleaceae bacterium]|nr:DUF2569 family protein [Defluviitaleaceae bacterium]